MMRVYKGIVCEKKNKYSVFITKEGEFLRGTPLGSNPEIGEEAHFHLFEASPQRRKWFKPTVLGPVLVVAMLFIFVVVSFIPNPEKALAFVQLDGRNAVELGVNKNGLVVTLRSLNETPIELEDWEGHPFDLVLEEAIKQMSPVSKQLAITTVYENKKHSVDMREMIENTVEEINNEHSEKVLLIKESTVEERNEANKQNTSIQKLKHKEHQLNTERKKLDTYIKDANKNNPNDNNKDKITPTKEKNENRKEPNEKIKEQQLKEQQLKEQEKLKEQLEKQKEKQTKEQEKQQKNLIKAKEKAAKEKEKQREKEREKAEKEQKNEQKKQEEKEKEKKKQDEKEKEIEKQIEKEKEKEKEEKHQKQDDQGEDDD